MPTVLDPVPSTFDVPLTAEPAQDAVLAVLRHARDRVRARHAVNDYIAPNGAVCAVGACWREEMPRDKLPRCRDHRCGCGGFETDAFERPEAWLTATVCEAITALDDVARELYPDAMGYENPDKSWIGARIEDVNQCYEAADAKRAVLRCYDVAIERRKAAA